MLLQVASSLDAVAWLSFYTALAGLLVGVALAVLWAPFLLAAGVRALFALGPTRSWPANYVLSFAALGFVHGAVLGAFAWTASGPTQGMNAAVVPQLLVPALAWGVACWLLPATDADWDPSLATRAVFGVGAAWYALLTGVPLVVLTVIYYMPM